MAERALQTRPDKLIRLFLIVTIVEGLAVLFLLFRVPSDVDNAFIVGYSIPRVLMGGLVLFVLLLFVVVLFRLRGIDINRPGLLQRLSRWLRVEVPYFVIQTTLAAVLVSLLSVVLFYLLPESQRLFPMVKEFTLYQPLGERAWALMAWFCFMIYKLMILLAKNKRLGEAGQSGYLPRWAIVLWTIAAYLFATFSAASLLHQSGTARNVINLALTSSFLALWVSLWSFLKCKSIWVARHALLFESISIWLVIFLISIQVALWFGVLYTPEGNSFNQLADAFLHGRIYLENPTQTYDLTMFNGRWYVPFPPFPAILILPFVAIFGLANFNTAIFSLVLSATTSVLLYLLFDQMVFRGWTDISKTGRTWLTFLFAFGTAQLWLSLFSTASFYSQITTVFCITLALLFTLKRFPPWLAGFCLAGAIISRPNTFTLWPALFFIELQLQRSFEEKINWKKIIGWSLLSATPIIFAIVVQLIYNQARFNNFMDFGYTTVNGADYILKKVQQYGVFSTHFISFNLYWMFLGFPMNMFSQCQYYIARGNGMSLILTTPAFIYLLRKVKISLWSAGAYISIFFSIALLAMYHNNGAIQVTYRYVMDFAVPMMMLIAANAGKKVSPLLKGLIAASILINYYCIISFFRGPC